MDVLLLSARTSTYHLHARDDGFAYHFSQAGGGLWRGLSPRQSQMPRSLQASGFRLQASGPQPPKPRNPIHALLDCLPAAVSRRSFDEPQTWRRPPARNHIPAQERASARKSSPSELCSSHVAQTQQTRYACSLKAYLSFTGKFPSCFRVSLPTEEIRA